MDTPDKPPRPSSPDADTDTRATGAPSHRTLPPWRRRSFLGSLGGTLVGAAAVGFPSIFVKAAEPGRAKGRVFHDRDGDGRRGADDPGLEGVFVSNGRELVATDSDGRWELPLLEGPRTDFFVVKPRDWAVSRSRDALPRHFHLHQPEGSPPQDYAGLAPTGPLPESIDFALTPQDEGESFRFLACGDPQPRDLREVDYIARTAPGPLREAGGAFGVNLGDIAFDDLTIYPALNGIFASTGHLWHNVFGNHDLNFDSRDDTFARETFRSVYGPTYYSFDHGPAHFVMLDNIEWTGADPGTEGSRGSYRGFLGEQQLAWLAADLATVPEDRLVVLFLHIPLRDEGAERPGSVTVDRQELYRLIEGRPRVFSFSAHRHHHRHDYIGAEDGWQGAAPHHHLICGTLCGSWFRGLPGLTGAPHATMSDGTPRGFIPVDVDGGDLKVDGYRVLGAPATHGMHIHAPDSLPRAEAAGAAYHVNFYNGCVRSKVRARLGEGEPWRELEKVEGPDPAFVDLKEAEGELETPWRTLPAAGNCDHLWRGALPEGLEPGTYALEIHAVDAFGRDSSAMRTVRVEA